MIAFNLIKFCYNSRATYLTRFQEPHISNVSILSFYQQIDSAITAIAQRKYPVGDPQHELTAAIRSLPTQLSGLGVHRHSWAYGQAGCVRSRLLTRGFIAHHYPSLLTVSAISWPPISVGCLNLPLPDADGPPLNNDEELADELDDLTSTQTGCYTSLWNRIHQHLLGSHKHALAAWFLSSRFDGSGKWLTPLTGNFTAPNLTLLDDEYSTSLRSRLLLHPYHDPSNFPFSTCHCQHVISNEPFHFLDCEHVKVILHARHHLIRDIVCSFLQKSVPHASVTREPPLATLTQPIFGDLRFAATGHHTKILDVTISDPAAPTYRNLAISSTTTPNATNNHREAEKTAKYNTTVPNIVNAGQFVPFAVEATGRLGSSASTFLSSIKTPEVSLKRLKATIETAIVKMNAQCISVMMNKSLTHNLLNGNDYQYNNSN